MTSSGFSNFAVSFMLPEFTPINRYTFNYAPIAVGFVLLFAGGYWLLSARKWFTGPRAQGSEAELENIEQGYTQVEQELQAVD